MSSWLWSIYYGVRSQPKFIVWILNSSSKFLNFYLNFIAEYNILYSSFRFRITGKRFYTRLLFFKLNSFISSCSPYIFNSLSSKLHLPSYISNSTLKIFNATFSFTLQWSLIKTICRGVGRGWLFSPSCFAPFCTNMAAAHLLFYKKLWSVYIPIRTVIIAEFCFDWSI